MTPTKAMLNVVMDGIRDAEMLYDYSDMEADNDVKNWFYQHGKRRLETLEQDYEFVKNKLKLAEKIKSGDEIAESLHCYIVEQIAKLEDRNAR